MFDKMNKAIGYVMSEIVAEKRNSTNPIAETARRVTWQLSKNLLENKVLQKVSPADLNRYYISKGTAVEKLLLSDGSQIKLDENISYAQLQRYFTGDTAVPIAVLAAFCQHFEMSLDDFMRKAYDREKLQYKIVIGRNLGDLSESANETPLKAFLNAEFGENNEHCAFDTEKKKDQFAPLFKEGETSFSYEFLHLPLDESLIRAGKKLQRGNIKFFHGQDNMCYLRARLDTTEGNSATYNGFAILFDALKTAGTCWCFLKRERVAEVLIMNFRLKDSKGDARIVEVIATKSIDSNPIVYRALLSRNFIKDEDVRYYEGHMMLNPPAIVVPGNDFNDIKNYFNNKHYKIEKENLKELNEHFKDIDDSIRKNFKEVINNIAGDTSKVVTIDYDKTNSNGVTYRNLFDNNYILSSWLRKQGRHKTSADNNKLRPELDIDIEKVYNWIYKRLPKESENVDNKIGT